MVTPKGFLTLDEAAEKLGCTPYRVQMLLVNGSLTRHVSAADRRRVLIAAEQVEDLRRPTPLPERRRGRRVESAAAA